jgi:outer membrane immunogenic protein
VDYTHIDLGHKTSTGHNVFDDGTLGFNPETYRTKARVDAVMARLTYKFDMGH